MKSQRYRSIACVSLSILMTELFWTRLFSAEFYYTFAFLVLSLAVLGLGLGALFFKMFIRTPRPAFLPVWLICTGTMILLAVPSVFLLQLDFAKLIVEPMQSVKLIGAIFLLGSANFFGGISLAHLLKANSEDIPNLYRADFLGAAAGVLLFVLIMNTFGGVATLLLSAVPVFLIAFLTSQRWWKVLPVILFASAALLCIWKGDLPEQAREERAPVIYKHWDATAKIKVYEYDSTYRGINIDNMANTPVYGFDGNWNVPDSQKVQFDIDVRNLITQFPKCRFLSLGAGGGGDVLQALQYNAAEIHAVEVIPHINHLMKDGFLKKFSGDIYNDPRVIVVTEDARAYIRKFQNKFDVIYSLSSNTFAAFASGSFALAENYLFTKEAFKDYWRALSDSGYMSLEHQFYGPRLVAELVDALQELGVPDPASHVAVYDLTTLRRKLILISKRPLDGHMIISAYANSAPNVLKGVRQLFPPTEDTKGNLIDAIVYSGWKSVADTARTDLTPCTDDRPFIAQMGLLRNLSLTKLDKIPLFEVTGFPLSRVIMIGILIVCLVLIVPINLVPYLMKGEKFSALPWLFFFAIGLGYMMIEVVLIQQYTLFIGSTIYSLALILSMLLVMSGIGSAHAARYSPPMIFLFIAGWILADIVLFRQVFYFCGAWPIISRLFLSSILIAPVGYFMGMPFPKAASRLPNLVDWAFAINGSASVIGSVVVILIATSFGYSLALLVALGVYLCAYALFRYGFKISEIQ
jgi:predicted membrane-bound spermidine synthase